MQTMLYQNGDRVRAFNISSSIKVKRLIETFLRHYEDVNIASFC